MPFIEDNELLSLQKQIDISIEEKEEVSEELEGLKEDFSREKKKSLVTNIIFGILAGLGIGCSLFLYSNNASGNIEEIKLAERTRLLDSISMNSDIEDEEKEETESSNNEETEQTKASSVKDLLKDKTVYAVQIKALGKNYPVISTALAAAVTYDKYYKYSVGVFDNLEDAHALRLGLIKLGFKDAFVASYINGERQAIHKP